MRLPASVLGVELQGREEAAAANEALPPRLACQHRQRRHSATRTSLGRTSCSLPALPWPAPCPRPSPSTSSHTRARRWAGRRARPACPPWLAPCPRPSPSTSSHTRARRWAGCRARRACAARAGCRRWWPRPSAGAGVGAGQKQSLGRKGKAWRLWEPRPPAVRGGGVGGQAMCERVPRRAPAAAHEELPARAWPASRAGMVHGSRARGWVQPSFPSLIGVFQTAQIVTEQPTWLLRLAFSRSLTSWLRLFSNSARAEGRSSGDPTAPCTASAALRPGGRAQRRGDVEPCRRQADGRSMCRAGCVALHSCMVRPSPASAALPTLPAHCEAASEIFWPAAPAARDTLAAMPSMPPALLASPAICLTCRGVARGGEDRSRGRHS